MNSTEFLSGWRKTRATYVGLRLSGAGAALALLAGILDASFSPPLVTGSDLLTALGCAISFLWTLRLPGKERRFVWWPAYFTFWINFIITQYYSGGAESPFIGLALVLLCIAGLIIQTRYRPTVVFAFTAMNYAGWAVATSLHWLPPAQAIPFSFGFGIRTILLIAIGTCLIALLRTERNLASELQQRISELTETQSNLIQASKMAELGTFVASAGHELSQPVQVISTATALLTRLITQPVPDRAKIEPIHQRIQDAAARMRRLLDTFRAYSRKEEFHPRLLDLREVVHSLEGIIQFDLRARNTELSVRLPPEAIAVRGDLVELQQILLNLVNNARDAAAGMAQARISVAVERAPHGMARLSVRDNGPGIPGELQGKVFETYFTTKGRSAGTGLGLSICAHLVDRHGGRILFSSQPGDTIFAVDLPAVTANSTVAVPA